MGPVYSMVITDPSPQMRAVHDRMPVIIPRAERDAWLAGEPEDALDLCRPYTFDLAIDRTDQRWVARR